MSNAAKILSYGPKLSQLLTLLIPTLLNTQCTCLKAPRSSTQSSIQPNIQSTTPYLGPLACTAMNRTTIQLEGGDGKSHCKNGSIGALSTLLNTQLEDRLAHLETLRATPNCEITDMMQTLGKPSTNGVPV